MPLGQRLLGDFYFNGEDGTPDRAIAEEWYARAARQGEPHAQDMLSWILTDGDHRKPDYKQARAWALKAAEQGVRRVHDAPRPALPQRAGRRARRRGRRAVVAQGRRCSAMPTGRRCWAPPIIWAPACRATPLPRSPG